jgi:polyhydroxyalkanoate synthesis regulator phasin
MDHEAQIESLERQLRQLAVERDQWRELAAARAGQLEAARSRAQQLVDALAAPPDIDPAGGFG